MEIDITQNILKLLNEPGGRIAFAIYCLCCVAGQFGNAAWLWLKDQIPCVMDRFRSEPKATIVSIITNLGAVAGIAIVMPWEAVPIQSAIVMGLFQGFSSDSALNKSTRPIWTAEQRAKAADEKSKQ